MSTTTAPAAITATALGRWRRAHHLVTTAIEAELVTRTGLTQTHFDVLDVVDEEPLRLNDVSRLAMLSASGLTRVVDVLERRDLAERSRAEEDRRGVLLSTTDAGHAALRDARPVYDELVEKHFNSLLVPELLEYADGAAAALTAAHVMDLVGGDA